MTVSRVINGEASVRNSTRESVNRAIEALGYSPNKAARSLASATQVRIGLLYANPSSGYLSTVLLGVLEQARQSDTQIVVVECEPGGDSLKVIRNMIKAGIDGILVTPPLADDPAALKLLKASNVVAVTMGSQHPEYELSSVSIDDYRAGYEMTKHIISLGHRRIGFIIGSPEHVSAGLRLHGYRDALEDAGLEVDPSLIAQGRYSYRSGLEAADRLLNQKQPPTAIFASNDDMAAATVATAHRYSIEVPEDLTVCGFDDTQLATTMWPDITTIRQPISDMSHTSIELLEKAIRAKRGGQAPDCQHKTLRFKLIKRHSDAPPAARSRPVRKKTAKRKTADGGKGKARAS